MRTPVTLLAIAAISAAAHAADNSRTADHDYDAPAPGSYTLPVIKPAADGALLDSKGKPVRLAEFTRGRITVMSFIYTRCAAAKACPYATGVLMQLHRESAADTTLAKALRLVSMSFDPANDTPERMAAYSTLAAERPTAAPWHFVTTRSQTELQPILTAYDQAVDKKQNALDPTGPLNHTLRVFLIDRTGNIRNIYSSGTLDLRLVLADVRTLIMESAQASARLLTPEEAARKSGDTVTVAFKVETTARVTDITTRECELPVEVLLLDARNGDDAVTATERAGIIASIPESARERFGARSLDELARRFENQTVTVTGTVKTEPHPFRRDANGDQQSRARITATEPSQIQIDDQP